MDYNTPAKMSSAPAMGPAPAAAAGGAKRPMMGRRPNMLFGPLKKKYCMYFYFLEVLGFIMFVFILLVVLYFLFKGTPMKEANYPTLIFGGIVYFIFYFQNRLLYNMCLNSVV